MFLATEFTITKTKANLGLGELKVVECKAQGLILRTTNKQIKANLETIKILINNKMGILIEVHVSIQGSDIP